MIQVKHLIIGMLAISVIGFFISLYLATVHYTNTTPECGALQGCEVVTTSKYATPLGIPLPLFGITFYVALMFLLGLFLQLHKKMLFHILLAWTAGGAAVSLVLLYTQIFVLDAVCVYCTVVDSISIALFILMMVIQKVIKPKYV